MKYFYTWFIPALILLFFNNASAQEGTFNNPILPLKPSGSPMFGKDIVINDQSDLDQRNIRVYSVYNGWLYAAYTFYNTTNSITYLVIMKSTDNGINWVEIYNEGLSYVDIKKLDMVVVGDSLENLRMFVASVEYNPYFQSYLAVVTCFLLEPCQWNGNVFSVEDAKDMAIVTDQDFPSINSNPYSISLLYSREKNSGWVKDSIIFMSSSNGGVSFDNRKVLSTTTGTFNQVALAFGRSQSWSTGRYYAAWETLENDSSIFGHIYTSHSEPNYNSPFTNPICLDSLYPSLFNKVRNPKIACQHSSYDNDNNNLSEVILFEKFNESSNSYNILGFSNVKAASTTIFSPFSLSDSTKNNLQPDICFNHIDSTFMVTYFDSTDKKLPFLTKNVNLANPDIWNIVSHGYNDNSNISSPFPKVQLNTFEQSGMNVWVSEAANGKGVAMFDASYSTYTGINSIKNSYSILVLAYPNPCSETTTLSFNLKESSRVIITIRDFSGKEIRKLSDQYYVYGKHEIKLNVSDLRTGTYLYNFQTNNEIFIGKLLIIDK